MKKFAKFIDHTLLKPEATEENFVTLCKEAKMWNFYSVCIPPKFIPLVKKELQNSQVKICTVIGFPLGYNTQNTKVAETIEAVKLGADEIDMVLNIGSLKQGLFSSIKQEIMAIQKESPLLKIIFETALLSTEEIFKATEILCSVRSSFCKNFYRIFKKEGLL